MNHYHLNFHGLGGDSLLLHTADKYVIIPRRIGIGNNTSHSDSLVDFVQQGKRRELSRDPNVVAVEVKHVVHNKSFSLQASFSDHQCVRHP